ncbi:MAG: xanthine dehydrogenase family protein molybdopterin-binding subunit [Chloroflexi bacterium]|nr:xanthine dehydrogenase family protein molybdopterin-binding subunit [Chloroflexota bacterium]
MVTRTYLGKPVPKVDALAKVTGAAQYGADFTLPGMLYARMLLSPHAHARIKRLDVSKALALEGALAVVTGDDVPPPPPPGVPEEPSGQSLSMGDLRKLVLAKGRVMFQGHCVAAVAAVTTEVAEQAVSLIEVEYEPLPAVFDPEEAMRPGAVLLHPDLFTSGLGGKATTPSNVATHLELGRGDVAKGFAQADVVVERSFRTQRVHQGYIEPDSETAMVYPDGRIVVWATTQGTFALRDQIAPLLKVPKGNIKIIPMEVGGAFGAKSYARYSPVIILLSKKSGRPVRLTLGRDQVLRDKGAPATVSTVKVGVKRDGTITAIQAKFIFSAGAYPGSPLAGGAMAGLGPYKTPNLKVDAYDVVTNLHRIEAYRAPGAPQANFAIECTMDEVAEKLGIDPLEFRSRNLVQEGDLMPNDTPFNRVGYREVLERVKSHPAWASPLGGPNRGRGLAVGFWRGGAGGQYSCTLMVNGDGSFSLLVGTVDLSGTRTGLAQMVAEEFSVPVEAVWLDTADTGEIAYTDESSGSRVTYAMSIALQQAVQDVMGQLKERAAAKLKVSAQDIEYRERKFSAKGAPDRAVTLQELATESVRGAGSIMGHGSTTRMQPAPVFAAHVADVEMDPETGRARLLRFTSFQDVGFAVNPPMVEATMQGGASQGIGWALSEEVMFDEKGGVRNPNLLDYRIPTAMDLPMLGTEIIEVPASGGPYGVRGTGEAPIVPPLAAVANAVTHATGVRVRELPLSPERVFWAKRQAGGSQPR